MEEPTSYQLAILNGLSLRPRAGHVFEGIDNAPAYRAARKAKRRATRGSRRANRNR